jgi:hypothetical protein
MYSHSDAQNERARRVVGRLRIVCSTELEHFRLVQFFSPLNACSFADCTKATKAIDLRRQTTTTARRHRHRYSLSQRCLLCGLGYSRTPRTRRSNSSRRRTRHSPLRSSRRWYVPHMHTLARSFASVYTAIRSTRKKHTTIIERIVIVRLMRRSQQPTPPPARLASSQSSGPVRRTPGGIVYCVFRHSTNRITDPLAFVRSFVRFVSTV